LKIDKNVKFNWDIHSEVVTNDILVVCWQNNRPVTILTTIHRLV
ncbi:7773_t:CDS:1, partial [Cetraspora pellucida]